MSFDAMAWASKQKPHNTTGKLCLLIMSSMANQDGKCWPSHRYLADQCLCSRRNIINVVRQLELDGYIESEGRMNGNEATSNMYTIALHRTPMDVGGSEHSSPPSEHSSPGGSEQAAHKTVTTLKQSVKQGKSRKSTDESYWLENNILEEWKAFKSMRRDIKKPMNKTAETMLINKLEKFSVKGHEKSALLLEAVSRCWQTVYEPKEILNGAHRQNNGAVQSPADRSAEIARKNSENRRNDGSGIDGEILD